MGSDAKQKNLSVPNFITFVPETSWSTELTAHMLNTSNAFVGSDLDIPNFMEVLGRVEEYESIGNSTSYALELQNRYIDFGSQNCGIKR